MADYEREQARLLRLWDEVVENDIPDEDDENEEDFLEELDHYSDTEQSANDEDEVVGGDVFPRQDSIHDDAPREFPQLSPSTSAKFVIHPRSHYIGKNAATKWNKFPIPKKTKISSHNIFKEKAGPKGIARLAKGVLETWQMFFPDTFIQKVVDYTNIYIQSVRSNYANQTEARDANITEMKAIFGLLYLAGVMKSSHLNLRDLWQRDGTGVEYFPLVMGINRFQFILRCLRFDDFNSRKDRKVSDKLAAIRELLEEFTDSCKRNYCPGMNVTIGEMLESFRGRCGFRQYIPNKPAKYGLKILAVVDSKSFYTYNLEVYAGTQNDGPYKFDNNPSALVKRLIQPLSGSSRNVTCDNWFTSIPLAVDLLENHKITLVGTLRKNKREIPPLFVQKMKERKINSSIFAFRDNMTLVSYKPKKDKLVIMLSTLHDSDSIDQSTGEAQKPEIITFYSATKGGVDVVDELKANYSISRTSRRWPLTLFFSFLNIGAVNSYILYKENTETNIKRSQYLRNLAKELTRGLLQERFNNTRIRRATRSRISEILGLEGVNELKRVGTTGRCYMCNSKKNRKTANQCIQCDLYVCREHTNILCTNCAGGEGEYFEED